MAKLEQDKEIAQKVSRVLAEHKIDRVTGSDILEILREKIAYDDLGQSADNLVNTELGGITDPKVLRQELYSLKEQSYEIKIRDLDKALLREGLGNFQYDYDLEKRRAVKTSHKTKRQTVSSEVYYNEKIRQISDLPYGSEVINNHLYVKPPDEVVKLRKQYEELYNQQYQIPKTTFKHEFVTLRQKIGRAIADKGGKLDDIEQYDPSYDYRRIADKVGTLENGTLSKEQREFLDRQVRYLENDVTVLKSYEDLAQQLGEDIKVPEKLSVKDKISKYRERLSSRLQDIADNAEISKKSPAYLDLVDSQRKKNPELYRKTVEDLSKEKGIGAWRAERWSSKEKHVPLTTWQELGKTIEAGRAEREHELFSATTEEFQELWKDPKYRSSVSWSQKLNSNGEPILRPDGTPLMIPDGISFVDKQPFRTDLDSDKLKDALQRRTEELKANTREELLRDTWESFNSKISSDNPKYRSSWGWEETKRSDGTVSRHLKGVVKFNGKFYREDLDTDQLQKDYDAAVKDSVSKIEEAKGRILAIKQQKIDNLEKEISDRKQGGKDTSKLEERLKKQRESIDAFRQKGYSYSDIKSYDLRASAIKSAADFLSAKADILRQDPFFDVNKILQGVKPEDRVETLEEAKRNLLLTVGPSVEGVKGRLEKRSGLPAPDWVSKQSLEKQLSWYRTAHALISDMESKSYEDFSAAIADINFGQLQRQLPKGYLKKVRGKIYRSTVDSSKISSFDDRESRILQGPEQKEQTVTQLNSFGKQLQQRASKQTLLDSATAAAQASNFSAAYSSLSSDARKVYDRNYGKPIKEGNTFYRSIYDMPDDVWAQAEKAAGFEVPRQRGVPNVVSDINATEEAKLQEEITENLKNRTWEPVQREDKTIIAEEHKKTLEEVAENTKTREESKHNLNRMLQRAKKGIKHGSIGSMGLAGAFVLFNAAMSGSSREAEEHRRRVEEERRIKKYGYNYQQ